MSTRERDERKFDNWSNLHGGGRHYWYDVYSPSGWYARYNKIVDRNEKTVRFFQEIFDRMGQLREIHEKYPIDEGHQIVKEQSS